MTAPPSDTAAAAIQLTDVAVTYPGPPPVHALRPTTLTIGVGEFVTITGPSGSGKSTLMNVFGLLDRPTSGTIRFEGYDLGELNETDRTALRGQRIGFVFQSFHLLPYRTAAENVALAQIYNRSPRERRRDAAVTALNSVGLSHRLDAMPYTMSGGEKQRVAIARALVNSPGVLLCDEPTGNLDSAAAAAVVALLKDLNTRGFTIIVVTHDPAVAARGSRRMGTRDGVIINDARIPAQEGSR